MGHKSSETPAATTSAPAIATPAKTTSSAASVSIDWVSIPGKSYRMSRSEVTVGQYRACVDAGVCDAPTNCDWGEPNWGKCGRDAHPVNCVSWEMANTFASWAGGRLPTEEEWEYAASGGESLEYAGSADLNEVAWYKGNSGGSTHAVCGKKRNGYGLCDMSGNVWEWTSSSEGSRRVSRGGSWGGTAGYVMVFNRDGSPPADRSTVLGFRMTR